MGLLTEHFSLEELACHHCGEMMYTAAALARLEALRREYGYAMPIISGYRCPVHNKKVSKTGEDGPHTKYSDDNIAVDVRVHGSRAYRLIQIALAKGWTGLGFQQKGPYNSRYIHLDRLQDSPRPNVWSY